MAAVLARYLAFTERRPLLSKVATAGTLTTAGDLLAQSLDFDKPLDLQRTMRLALWGFAWGGPTMHVWWRYLDKRYAVRDADAASLSAALLSFGTRGVRPAIYKTAADQLLFSPPGLVVFFTYMGLMQGQSLAEIGQKIKHDYWPTMFANWAVWPTVQLFNFAVLPPSARVLFVSSVAIAWNGFLSVQGHKPAPAAVDDALTSQTLRTPQFRAN